MPLLLEIEGLSMPMSRVGGGLVDNYTSDTCGGGGEGSVNEEACDTCKGEGGGGEEGGRMMGDTSGLGRGVGRKRRMGRS